MIVGGNGIFQFSLIGNRTLPHGHAFILFMTIIIISTLCSAVLADVITSFLEAKTFDFVVILVSMMIIVLGLFVDMHLTYLHK